MATSASLSDRIQDLLPALNLVVLLIPIVAAGVQLSSSAAELATATSPVDVAELETPPLRPQRSVPTLAPQPTAERPSSTVGDAAAPAPEFERRTDPGFGVGDPLLGYGL